MISTKGKEKKRAELSDTVGHEGDAGFGQPRGVGMKQGFLQVLDCSLARPWTGKGPPCHYPALPCLL